MEIDLRTVRPTQAAIGQRVVFRKIRELSRMEELERQRFLIERAAPIILGPQNTIFIQDRHHEFSALVQMGLYVGYGKLNGDFSHLDWDEFKEVMTRRKKVHLSRLGLAISFDDLPVRIDQMIDDPHRSVASEIRKAGGFKKSPEPFGENEWADALRQIVPLEVAMKFPESAVMIGAAWAHSHGASHLPGYFRSRSCNQLHVQFVK